ncbi:Activator of 90 kDa heat shock protein ATPase like protein 1 [Tupaia chinensis]|uniref:Activator of 90 kDa heat shock protein ATPase like protein 1 n=1 Tax=Tupaia chinensis TaxID=246437 RepID=L9KFY6_TUPCH|nr:Activator of 90 kDa heat shock protein ATPase like protein 1 [Tupaia chinensis]
MLLSVHWPMDKLKTLFLAVRVQNEEGRCEVTAASKLDGEASINNRKGKLTFFYEWSIRLNWTGTSKSGVQYKGPVEIPDVSDGNGVGEVELREGLPWQCRFTAALRRCRPTCRNPEGLSKAQRSALSDAGTVGVLAPGGQWHPSPSTGCIDLRDFVVGKINPGGPFSVVWKRVTLGQPHAVLSSALGPAAPGGGIVSSAPARAAPGQDKAVPACPEARQARGDVGLLEEVGQGAPGLVLCRRGWRLGPCYSDLELHREKTHTLSGPCTHFTAAHVDSPVLGLWNRGPGAQIIQTLEGCSWALRPLSPDTARLADKIPACEPGLARSGNHITAIPPTTHGQLPLCVSAGPSRHMLAFDARCRELRRLLSPAGRRLGT